MDATLRISIVMKTSLDFELELPCAEAWSPALAGPVCPFAMYPFVQILMSAKTPEAMSWVMGSVVTQYSLADIEVLQADLAKQARFCEVRCKHVTL
jgi:hypothetical protein